MARRQDLDGIVRSPAIHRRVGGGVLIFLLLTPGCARPIARLAAEPAPAPRFVDVTAAAGIDFHHTSGACGRLYLPETMGSGGGFLDYDGDGWQDIFLVNGAGLPGFQDKGPFYPALYRNRWDGTFQDVTPEVGLTFECYGMGCAAGDYDNDGNIDLYLTAMGQDRLLRNERGPDGQARFVDATPAVMRGSGSREPHWGTSAAWVDFDRDGDLDLFVCRYALWSLAVHRVCRDARGQLLSCTPEYYAGDPSVLYRNEGGGRFTDVTRRAGLYSARGKSLGIAVTDVDGDGWPDLVVANDQEPNALFRNNRDGTFTDEAVLRGTAYGMTGKARAGMGIDTLGMSNGGAEAIFIGNRNDEGHAFFQPDARGNYSDRAHDAGILEPGLSSLTFGALFCDYDLDGRSDLLTANGHVEPNVELIGGSVTLAQRPLVFHQESLGPDGTPHFAEVGATLGPALATRRIWRGLAWADYDNDGDPDFLVTACNGRPMLLRNDLISTNDRRPPSAALAARSSQLAARSKDDPLPTPSREPRAASREQSEPPHWLKIQLVGRKSNRSGLGSRVTVEAGGRRQTGWVRSGSSYCSSSEQKALFGLGDTTRVDRVVVRWASGGEEELREVPVDRFLVIREGAARGGP